MNIVKNNIKTKNKDILDNSTYKIYTFDDKIGYVELIDSSPRLYDEASPAKIESRIIEAARTSYISNNNKKTTLSGDTALIKYLFSHKHMSPFEFLNCTFKIKMPLFVMAQWIRHRTSSTNCRSARYSQMVPEYYIPSRVKQQSTDNKQGTSMKDVSPEIKLEYNKFIQHAISLHNEYDKLIECGVAKELCRIALPQNLYTVFYWQANLRNILHLLNLRMDEHAQWEIRQYANAMYHLIKLIFPITIKCFDDYVNGSITVHKNELDKKKLNKRESKEWNVKKKLLDPLFNELKSKSSTPTKSTTAEISG